MKKSPLFLSIICFTLSLAILLGGCSSNSGTVKLDPKNPITISVWHYYNGPILNAFDALVKEFNETVGMEMGIIIEGYAHGNVSELEKAVMASAKKEIGSMAMPNIFASYADTAYEAEKLGLLADLDTYFTADEQKEYLESYVEEGRIGLNGELRIFPIAKSTEIFMINETDWLPFAAENGFDYGDLGTMEELVEVSKTYYEWTDAQTPDVPNDGKAFFGRDSRANFFIISVKEFGAEIFEVSEGKVTINTDETIMRRIWDNYYIPFISGYFYSFGKYSSEDTKVGDILAYVGSTSSASYFPSEVTAGGSTYSVTAKALPAPHFSGANKAMVQQGAGMVVTKATPAQEYASVEFMKWFTRADNNIQFAAVSGYMPVKAEANNYDAFISRTKESGINIDPITDMTLQIAFNEMSSSELYTNKAFDGGAAARSVLEYSLQDKAVADREDVIKLLDSGNSLEEAVAKFNTDENFNQWLQAFTTKLNEVAGINQ